MSLKVVAWLLLSVFCASSLLGFVSSRCANTSLRKEIRDLTLDELSRFINAIKLLHSTQDPNIASLYDQLVKIHLDWVPYAHGIPAFLPWHRYYVWYFERILQMIDPSVTVPYWDWSYDSQSPERSVVFNDRYFGGNSNGSCLTSGPFANWQAMYPSPHCLTRSFDGGNVIGAFESPEAIQLIISQSTDYDSFRQAIEGAPHGLVHTNIGGDMSTMYSPNDAIFWLHHAYVDKLWRDWQNQSPNFKQMFDSDSDPTTTSAYVLQPFGLAVEKVLAYENMCYEYQEPQTIMQSGNSNAASTSNIQSNVFSSLMTDDGDDTLDDPIADSPAHALLNSLLSHNVSYSNAHKNLYEMNSSLPSFSTIMSRNPNPFERQTDKLRIPAPVSELWLLHMDLNISYVRDFEHALAHVYDTLNQLPDYVSPSAPSLSQQFNKLLHL